MSCIKMHQTYPKYQVLTCILINVPVCTKFSNTIKETQPKNHSQTIEVILYWNKFSFVSVSYFKK